MTHKEVRADLCDYLEGDLPLPRRALVDAHLDSCPPCATHLRTLRGTIDALHALDAPEPEPGLAERVLARIEAGEGQPGALVRLLDRIPWPVRARLGTPAVLLVAAAVLFLWLRPASEEPAATLGLHPQQRLDPAKPIGASVPPDPESSANSSGPAAARQRLERALRDPTSVLRATEALGPNERDAWFVGLVRGSSSEAEREALARALRALPDPRGAVVAAALERLGGAGEGR
jgi:hypothetical protein